ncbi:hypothetical protein FA15DRAFT_704983 [Coprinopsis marcescibilis]|uniref:Nephrocystin 3-like N-terminal domain-containing protein n=1 Tax=Coprinopsis marcescibilis TaxID=230819 RepID=A0A5C3KUC8_COPMA|nr:hypothetical protein FA15DRAFT_704983 [Coprinopsis marcescibilis]
MPLFQEAHGFNVNGGVFNDYSTVNNGVGPLAYIQQYVAPGAAHDSHERFPPPRCHPATRERALSIIIAWAKLLRNDRLERVLWLHAPAGMGKSAIAQTIAEQCEELDILAATFFFYRLDPKRNRAERLVASIAAQLCDSIPELVPHIEAVIRSSPAILTKSLPVQLKRLVIDPLRKIPLIEEDRVVIIDGLDECLGPGPPKVDPEQEQLLVLKLIDTLISSDLPLSVLICSRPESWIQDGFKAFPRLWASTKVIDLCQHSDMDADIETFFRVEFDRIREQSNLPVSWPSEQDIRRLTWKASGQFIYASTVIRYIEDPWKTPTDRLEVILSPVLPADHNPLEALDNLYITILNQSPNHALTVEVLGCLKSHSEVNIPYIYPKLFRLFQASLAHIFQVICNWPRHALRGLHSLVRVSEPLESRLYDSWKPPFFHSTFSEFLGDPARSASFHIPSPWPYLSLLANNCLLYLAKKSRIPIDWDTPFDVIAFASHYWEAVCESKPELLTFASTTSELDTLDALLAYDLRFNTTRFATLEWFTLHLLCWLKYRTFSEAKVVKANQCIAHLQGHYDQNFLSQLQGLDGSELTFKLGSAWWNL